jgi:hypothetical protein
MLHVQPGVLQSLRVWSFAEVLQATEYGWKDQ